jgi:hypothetical protein
MTHTDALELARLKDPIALAKEWQSIGWPSNVDEWDRISSVCEALLSLSSRLERYERIVVAARAARDVAALSKTILHGSQLHDYLERTTATHQALYAALDALDADPVETP